MFIPFGTAIGDFFGEFSGSESNSLISEDIYFLVANTSASLTDVGMKMIFE